MPGSTLRTAAIAGLVCGALLAPVALAGAARPAHAADAAPCATSQLEIWLGDGGGGGTAGHTYYPIEFSNVGHSSCTLYGYPGVSAWGLDGKQIGVPASNSGASHSTVTITPGGTAHALLAIADWGALCSKGVSALGLKVYPPGQKGSQSFSFPLEVCASRSVLVSGPVRAGVGIPGYTNS
jgi:hypothetical protein